MWFRYVVVLFSLYLNLRMVRTHAWYAPMHGTHDSTKYIQHLIDDKQLCFALATKYALRWPQEEARRSSGVQWPGAVWDRKTSQQASGTGAAVNLWCTNFLVIVCWTSKYIVIKICLCDLCLRPCTYRFVPRLHCDMKFNVVIRFYQRAATQRDNAKTSMWVLLYLQMDSGHQKLS